MGVGIIIKALYQVEQSFIIVSVCVRREESEHFIGTKIKLICFLQC